MNKNKLSKNLSEELNTHMTKEAQASQIYLSYASWAENNGFGRIANFLFRHAEEERNHMIKILEYILKRGAEVRMTVIPAPAINSININSCFEKIFEHEVEYTKTLYKLVKMSFEEEDWVTWNFMQWFVKEQIQEETLAVSLLDNMEIVGGNKENYDDLYTLDREKRNTSKCGVSALGLKAACS